MTGREQREPNGRIRVLVVDDHAIVRSGIRLLLEQRPDLDVVGDVASAGEALRALSADAADVALVDVTLEDGDGIALTRLIRERWPDTKVVALTMHDDPVTVRQMLRAGACAYVVKGAQAYELLDAIQAAHRSAAYVHPTVAPAVIADAVRGGSDAEQLSQREQDVIRLLASGRTSRECAAELGISPHTVDRHVANVMRKLGLRRRSAVVRYAERILAGEPLPPEAIEPGRPAVAPVRG